MTTETKKASVFSRAEGGSRALVLMVGLGMVGFVLGGIFSAGVMARLTERVGFIENASVAFAIDWIVQRLWLFLMIPVFGWGIGRFTGLSQLRFAVVACLSGETFSVLLFTAINGFDTLFDDPPLVITRLVTLFIGMAITVSAANEGRKAARVAQLEADAIAEKTKAEYAEFLAKQEGASAPSSNSGSGSN